MRTKRLAIAAALAGGMLAVAILGLSGEKSAPLTREEPAPARTGGDRASALSRCREVAQPDRECLRLWETERRRFFGLPNDESTRPDME